jgi:hypothetical protein
MIDNSTDRLIAVLEPVREFLRYVENAAPNLYGYALQIRLCVDREIENIKQTDRR